MKLEILSWGPLFFEGITVIDERCDSHWELSTSVFGNFSGARCNFGEKIVPRLKKKTK